MTIILKKIKKRAIVLQHPFYHYLHRCRYACPQTLWIPAKGTPGALPFSLVMAKIILLG